MATTNKAFFTNTPHRYGRNLLLGGLLAIFTNVFFLSTPELASGIRYGGALMVVAGGLIWIFGYIYSKRLK